jgi:hypothetical protein
MGVLIPELAGFTLITPYSPIKPCARHYISSLCEDVHFLTGVVQLKMLHLCLQG